MSPACGWWLFCSFFQWATFCLCYAFCMPTWGLGSLAASRCINTNLTHIDLPSLLLCVLWITQGPNILLLIQSLPHNTHSLWLCKKLWCFLWYVSLTSYFGLSSGREECIMHKTYADFLCWLLFSSWSISTYFHKQRYLHCLTKGLCISFTLANTNRNQFFSWSFLSSSRLTRKCSNKNNA